MHVRDLGPLLVEVDGQEVTLGGKIAAILGMLGMHANRRVSVDALIDAVWGDDAASDRVGTLESHIWRLRRILEPERKPRQPPRVLVNDATGYRLLALTDEIDSTRFEKMADDIRELLAEGEWSRSVQVADAALQLWRGSPYEAISDHSVVAPVIARLTEAHRQVCARRIDALLEVGADARALQDLTPLLDAAPFDEHLWAARMLTLHRLGRTQEALQTFRDARTTLLDNVGIEPGDELSALQHKILTGDLELLRRNTPSVQRDVLPAAAAVPAHAASVHMTDNARPQMQVVAPPAPAAFTPDPSVAPVPVALTELIGRGDTLTALAPLIAAHPLVTITGPAGCGKTRVSIELARQVSGTFGDGVWFIDLALVHEPSLVPAIVLSTVGIAPPSTGSSLDGLRAFCRDRAVLLVLDNCEHVLDAASAVAETLVSTSQYSRVVATSREPLDIDGEVLWTLGPLALPELRPAADISKDGPGAPGSVRHIDRGRADEAQASPAVTLFLDRLRAADPQRTMSEEDRRLAVEICVALDGLPLAIELAAARIRSATLREIADQVTQDPTGLRRLGRVGPRGQSTLRDMIDAGYQLLPDAEQTLHRRLGMLPGAFTRDAATAVAVDGSSGAVDAPDVVYLLDSLVRRSLLSTVPAQRAGSPTLFRQLATVRGHALHVLRVAGEDRAVVRRRDAWVAEFVAARPRIAHSDDAGWYLAAHDALPTIRATLEHTLIAEPTSAGPHLVTGLGMFWYHRLRLVEGQRWIELAAAAPEHDPVIAISAQLGAAAVDAIRGRADLAVPRVDAALTRISSASSRAGNPGELIDLGDLHAPLAIALAPSGSAPTVFSLARSVADLAQITGDAGLDVLADALQAAAQVRSNDPRSTAVRNAEVYERAINVGHLFAALIAAGTNVAIALAAHNPEGRVWAERSHQLHRSQGGAQNGLVLESSGNFAAFGGDPHSAVRQLSASRATANRAGTTWPRHLVTRTTLAELEQILGPSDFDRTWREGRAVGLLTAARSRP